jgi:calcineurin-like phosphoesterase family protein
MIYFVGQPKFNSDPKNDFPRGQHWDDTESMNEDLISYWNETVGKEDQVFVLGEFLDFSKNLSAKSIEKLVSDLNGNILHVYHNQDRDIDFSEYIGVCILGTTIQYRQKTIHITNFLEHINRIESNLMISSCRRSLLNKINAKSIYYHKNGSTIFQNNISRPVFNVNIELWGYKPISIETILNSYSLYLKQNEDL